MGLEDGVTTKDAVGAVDILGPTILPTTDITGSGGYRSGDIEPFFNGTSCATPYVAGVAALIKSANPGLTPAEVRARLWASAGDVVNVESFAGWDRYSGFGMVDAEAAVGGTEQVVPVASFTGTPVSGNAPLNGGASPTPRPAATDHLERGRSATAPPRRPRRTPAAPMHAAGRRTVHA